MSLRTWFRPVECKAVYLCAAAVAATSMANCLMVLSSRYFCSQRTMSASRARILSSRSLSRSLRSSCSSRVLSFISRVSLFSQALFLLSSSSSWRPRPRAASSASSSRLALRLCSSAVDLKRSSSRSTRSRSEFCSSSEAKGKVKRLAG
ncbi:hypothetical protein EYF80_047200 [Liparis tanakae]|uniref:Uncharacterized protein n=1 Tax=Liparis tanakae TaxID=230148 RepID=A0A4Z2FPA0_9TELE|nr:hypothetical protein EYF80_047200 [Liparis tanakae]